MTTEVSDDGEGERTQVCRPCERGQVSFGSSFQVLGLKRRRWLNAARSGRRAGGETGKKKPMEGKIGNEKTERKVVKERYGSAPLAKTPRRLMKGKGGLKRKKTKRKQHWAPIEVCEEETIAKEKRNAGNLS